MLSGLQIILYAGLLFASLSYRQANESSKDGMEACHKSTILNDGSKVKIVEIRKPSPNDRNRYTSLYQEMNKSCNLFMAPIPERVFIKGITKRSSEKITPDFIVLHRCDKMCSSKPNVVDVKFTIQGRDSVDNNVIRLYKLIAENHTSCN